MSYEAVDGVVNPNGNWGVEGVFTETLEFDGSVDSAHEILRRLAEFGVTAEFIDGDIQAEFQSGVVRIEPSDTVTVFWPIGPDD